VIMNLKFETLNVGFKFLKMFA